MRDVVRAASVKIEWEEDGCYIVIDGDSLDPDYMAGEYRWRLEDPEQAYDAVRAGIWPWIAEKEEAYQEFKRARAAGVFACDPDESGGYDLSDPKHPDWHSVHADIWDARAGK